MNLEQRKEQKRQWYIENKERLKEVRKEYSKIYRLENKDKIKEYDKQYRFKNKDKAKKYQKEYNLKTKYNLTPDQYNKMLSDQNNSCKVCNIKFNINIKMITPHVDHCHTTGKIRGLLCMNCNTSLGFLKEDTKIMQKLIEYVKEHNE